MQPGVVPGAVFEFAAGRARSGLYPGVNVPPVGTAFDTSGHGNHGTLTDIAYEPGDRPRTNTETDKDKWHAQSGGDHDLLLHGLNYTDESGWRGNGSAEDPYALRFDGESGSYAINAARFAQSSAEFTIDIVFRKPTGAVDSDTTPVIARHGYSNSSGWSLRQYSSSGTMTMVAIRSGAQENLAIPGGGFTRDEWHHLLIVISNTALTMTVCRDGVWKAPVAMAYPMVPCDISRDFELGAGGVSYNWGGDIAAFRAYYGKLFDADDAAQNHAAGFGAGYVTDGLTVDLSAARAVRSEGWNDSPHRLTLDGSGYVALPDLGVCEDGSFTFEVWALGTVGAGDEVLLGEGNSANNNKRADLRTYNGRVYFAMQDGVNPIVQVGMASGSIADGSIHHIIGSCNGSLMTTYLDNASIGTPATPPAEAITVDRATLGASGRTFYGYYWSGSIYVARIYPFAFDADDVAQNFAAGYEWGPDVVAIPSNALARPHRGR